jgi:hypothetical protein
MLPDPSDNWGSELASNRMSADSLGYVAPRWLGSGGLDHQGGPGVMWGRSGPPQRCGATA